MSEGDDWLVRNWQNHSGTRRTFLAVLGAGIVSDITVDTYNKSQKMQASGEVYHAKNDFMNALTDRGSLFEEKYAHSLHDVESDAVLENNNPEDFNTELVDIGDGVGSADNWNHVTSFDLLGNYSDVRGLEDQGLVEDMVEDELSEVMGNTYQATNDFLMDVASINRDSTQEQITEYTWVFTGDNNSIEFTLEDEELAEIGSEQEYLNRLKENYQVVEHDDAWWNPGNYV